MSSVKHHNLWLLLLLLAGSRALAAADGNEQAPGPPPGPTGSTPSLVPVPPPAPPNSNDGVFLSDTLRYRPEAPLATFEHLILRVAMDLIAIPASAPRWSALDWTLMGSTVAVTAAMSVSVHGPSVDLQIQDRIHEKFGSDHFRIWTKLGDGLVYATLGASMGAVLLTGILAHRPAELEGALLVLEAFSATEIFHAAIKVVIGREGVFDGSQQGYYLGPGRAIRYFPSGTPSGHMASLMSVVGALTTYYHSVLLDVTLAIVMAVLGVTLVTDDYHYTSDVIIGAALGYAVGRWVVRHRSSHFRDEKKGAIERLADGFMLGPLGVPGALGAGVGVRF